MWFRWANSQIRVFRFREADLHIRTFLKALSREGDLSAIQTNTDKKKCGFKNLRICLEGAKLNVLSLSLSQENHSYFSILISQTHTLE